MYTHAPNDYVCPICLGVRGIENERTLVRSQDIVYRDDQVMAFIASYFIGENPGHVIVVPLEHYENLYALPEEVGAQIFTVSKQMSLAMKKAYSCEGVMVLQNNEPASGQHAFHYHLHLFPRYENDDIFAHMGNKRETTLEERVLYAQKIRDALV